MASGQQLSAEQDIVDGAHEDNLTPSEKSEVFFDVAEHDEASV